MGPFKCDYIKRLRTITVITLSDFHNKVKPNGLKVMAVVDRWSYYFESKFLKVINWNLKGLRWQVVAI